MIKTSDLPTIKDPALLFENQLPRTMDTFIQGWYTSILKLEKMCNDPAFKGTFWSIYKKEHSKDFNFKEVTNKAKILCNNLDVFSGELSKRIGKKFAFRSPLFRTQKKESIKIGENQQLELDTIKEILSKTKQKMNITLLLFKDTPTHPLEKI